MIKTLVKAGFSRWQVFLRPVTACQSSTWSWFLESFLPCRTQPYQVLQECGSLEGDLSKTVRKKWFCMVGCRGPCVDSGLHEWQRGKGVQATFKGGSHYRDFVPSAFEREKALLFAVKWDFAYQSQEGVSKQLPNIHPFQPVDCVSSFTSNDMRKSKREPVG